MSCCLIIGSLIFESSFSAEPDELSKPNFIYTPDQMLNFDIEAYLQSAAPHLVSYSEVISHWSAYSSISPKILITLLEHQADIVSRKTSIAEVEKALSRLSTDSSLDAQIEDILNRLAITYYKNLDMGVANPELDSLAEVLDGWKIKSKQFSEATRATSDFPTTFFRLFPQKSESDLNAGPGDVQAKVLPPENLFQLPYPVGDSWQTWGGTHTYNGSGVGPFSSLDFRKYREDFGADTSNYWVSSASAGTAVKHSSCFVEVLGPSGWSTVYYHLDNVQVSGGQNISRNTKLANYADNLDQSICSGGKSIGPHVHFSLKFNGAYHSLDDVVLSGYRVNAGRHDYDGDCFYFWLDNNGSKICAGTPVPNSGVGQISRPDLIMNSFATESEVILVEEMIAVSATVANSGNAVSEATQLSFLLSNDANISLDDSQQAIVPVESIGSGGNSTGQVQFAAPKTAGQYWLGACVLAVANETKTTNNCSAGVSITVEKKPTFFIPYLILFDEDD